MAHTKFNCEIRTYIIVGADKDLTKLKQDILPQEQSCCGSGPMPMTWAIRAVETLWAAAALTFTLDSTGMWLLLQFHLPNLTLISSAAKSKNHPGKEILTLSA